MTKGEINARLMERYGLDLSGKPKYRVVWSDDETERRIGEVEVYYGDIFVRREHGLHTVKKYSYISERWVLETLVPTHNPELMEKLSYEPIWVFQDKDGNYLPLNWDAITILIHSVENRETSKRTEAQDKYDAEQRELKEKKEFRQKLDDVGSTDFQRKLRSQELILNPGIQSGD